MEATATATAPPELPDDKARFELVREKLRRVCELLRVPRVP